MRKSLVVLLPILIIVVLLKVPTLSGAQKSEALFLKKCTHCHNTERVCKYIGRHNPLVWRKTIEWMQSKGAKINNSEKITIAMYLGTLQRHTAAFCKQLPRAGSSQEWRGFN